MPTGRLSPRIQPLNLPRPIQYLLIGGYEWKLTVDGGGHNETVGGVAVQIFQLAGEQSNPSIEWNFNQAGLSPVGPPAINWHGQDDAPPFGEHRNLPKTDGTDGDHTGTPAGFDLTAGLRPQSWVVAIHPQQGVGIQNHVAAFQRSSSSGAITSP